jgi:hypothetical protein
MNFDQTALSSFKRKEKVPGLGNFYKFCVLSDLLSNLALNHCDHYIATPGEIRVK